MTQTPPFRRSATKAELCKSYTIEPRANTWKGFWDVLVGVVHVFVFIDGEGLRPRITESAWDCVAQSRRPRHQAKPP